MLRPSVILSLLTAMLTTEVTRTSSNVQSAARARAPQTSEIMKEEASEELKILADARLRLGRELSEL